MIRQPKVGDTGELSFIVTKQHIIDFADQEMPAVLCTPWLIWFLEHAAREAMLAILETSESTVGIHVDVQHLAPTPIGGNVTCSAQVIHVDGNVVTFSIKAHDDHELIARGTHKLSVVEKVRLNRRVSKKLRA